MRYAKPRQQVLFSAALLIAGVASVITGAWIGSVLLLLLGIAFDVRCVRLRLHARRAMKQRSARQRLSVTWVAPIPFVYELH
jgi:hypothetical protein